MAGDEPHRSKTARILHVQEAIRGKLSEIDILRHEMQGYKDRAALAIREGRLFEMVLTILCKRSKDSGEILAVSKAELSKHRVSHGFRLEVSKTDGAMYLHFEDENEQPAADERVGEGNRVDSGEGQPAVQGGAGEGCGS